MSEEKVVLERSYVVPLRKAYSVPRKKRANVAVRILREFVARHTKADEVWISNRVNEYIWSRSAEKPPRRVPISVKVYEYEGEEGEKLRVAEVYLSGELEGEEEEGGQE